MTTTKTKHTHVYELGKSGKIETCSCGKWRHAGNFEPIVGVEAKTKHTQGPWHVLPYAYILNKPTRARIHGANNEPVIDDCNPSIQDALLIASAPELLAKLKEVVEWIEFKQFSTVLKFEAQKLISKAEGTL